jgi:hypothetical protein
MSGYHGVRIPDDLTEFKRLLFDIHSKVFHEIADVLSCCDGQTVYLSKRSFKSLASPEAGQPLQQFLDLIQKRQYTLNNAAVVSD